MKRAFIITFIIVAIILSCTKKPTETTNGTVTLANPETKFAVFSDPHYFNPDLGTAGTAFEAKVSTDRKMLAESEALLEAVIDILRQNNLDFILIPGDLTKDGEQSGHQKVAAYLLELEQAGIEVYVVPGNHDINNVYAESYNGSSTTPVPTITAAEFESIYQPFGFDQALYRDPESLTYIIEPVDGLWIFCMDACRYRENVQSVFPGGRFQTSTYQWIRDRLTEARTLGKMVFGMMHHGILEHFEVQADYFPDFVIENWESVSQELANMGMRVVFTGHFHAQDIVMKTTPWGFVFDIETGSTVTYPCPYRLLELQADYTLKVRSNRIQDIEYDLGGKDLQTYAREFLMDGILDLALIYAADYGITVDEVEEYGPTAMQAALDHFAGDETWSSEAQALLDEINRRGDLYASLASQALESIYNDPPPADNDIDINLKNGTVTLPSLSARLTDGR